MGLLAGFMSFGARPIKSLKGWKEKRGTPHNDEGTNNTNGNQLQLNSVDQASQRLIAYGEEMERVALPIRRLLGFSSETETKKLIEEKAKVIDK